MCKGFFCTNCTSEFWMLLLLNTNVLQMFIIAVSYDVMILGEFCAFIKLTSILMHTYLHKPRKISNIIVNTSGESYADYGPWLETMRNTMPFTMWSCQVMAFLQALFSCDPGFYLHVIEKTHALVIHWEYKALQKRVYITRIK